MHRGGQACSLRQCKCKSNVTRTQRRTRDLKATANDTETPVVIASAAKIRNTTAGNGRVLVVAEAVVVGSVILAKVLGEVAVQEALFLARTHNLAHKQHDPTSHMLE